MLYFIKYMKNERNWFPFIDQITGLKGIFYCLPLQWFQDIMKEVCHREMAISRNQSGHIETGHFWKIVVAQPANNIKQATV